MFCAGAGAANSTAPATANPTMLRLLDHITLPSSERPIRPVIRTPPRQVQSDGIRAHGVGPPGQQLEPGRLPEPGVKARVGREDTLLEGDPAAQERKSPDSRGLFRIAGAGFEPATFGL